MDNYGVSLVAVGLSHKTASVALRERVSLNADDLPGALAYLDAQVGNGVILSTCNRTELYFVGGPECSAHQDALNVYLGVTGARQEQVSECTYFYRNEAAVRHLHRVACGMDSMIFGEVEVLRQVRGAMNASFEAGLLTSILDRLFHSALRAGRLIHAETYLGRHDRSVASAAATLARGVLGDISESEVLVLGAGDAGAMTVKTMLREGATKIRVANRTYVRAEELAGHTGTVAVPLQDVPELLTEVDLVICASASPLLSREALLAVLPTRTRGPLVLVDIGVPRNVDASIRDMPGIHLFDMDDLMTMCPASPEDRELDLSRADCIFEEQIERFLSWWRSSHAVPTIAALEERIEEARRREVAKTLRRLPSLDEEEKEALDALTKALVKKVLHQPITRLKLHGDDSRYVAIGREMFGIETNGARPHADVEAADVQGDLDPPSSRCPVR